jgi:diguanylate cyclase (GGDEF)-like protein
MDIAQGVSPRMNFGSSSTEEDLVLTHQAASIPTIMPRDITYFNDRLLDEIARSKRYKYDFSILLIEMDNMDVLADKCGKDAARDHLDNFRIVLADSLRNTDIICHFDSSRFGVILPYCTSLQGRIAAERVRGNVARIFATAGLSSDIQLTASIGLATYPDDAVSHGLLITNAVYALSTAKLKGGNCVCLVSEPALLPDIGNEAGLQAESAFLQWLDDEIARCSRYGQHFSLAIIAINSRDGHFADDLDPEIMSAARELLTGTLRETDRCFPYSVDKCAVLMSNTASDGAQICIQKLLRSLSSKMPVLHDGRKITIAANIGIASFPLDEVSRESLLHLAEAALIRSYRDGPNKYRLASATLEPAVSSDGEVRKWICRLNGSSKGIAFALVSAVDLTEQYTRPHSQGTARYAVAIGQALGLPNHSVRQLRLMGQVHDIGKRCIHPSIITNPGPLDSSQYEAMRRHAEYGAEIIEKFPDLSACAPAIRYHHERWDGTGYPSGLKGSNIPLEARIISVAEAFEDMTTKRPYKSILTAGRAVEELLNNAEEQFDSVVVKACITALTSLKEI